LDATCWVGIFERVCHKNLGISRPSIKSVRDFCTRLYKPWTKLTVEMGKAFKVCVTIQASQYIMEFMRL
jgi:hypothetical protein